MIILGLGSNETPELFWFQQALFYLNSHPQMRVLRTSSVYISQALVPPGSPPEWNKDYHNMAVGCTTSLSPNELLIYVKHIEKILGRMNSARWAPRNLDIDILAWNDEIIESPDLKIPHSDMHIRLFALLPFKDILPHWEHPIYSKSLDSIIQDLKKTEATENTRKSSPYLTRFMGIINLTPDSFSDGNPHLSLSSVETQIQEFKDSNLIEILDIGAESTRPGAQLLSPEEEWERIKNFIPLFQKASQTFKISLDTRHFETLEKFHALCPVSFWNCVSLPENTDHLRKFAALKIPLILMHHLSIPPNPNDTLKTSSTFYLEIRKWFQEKITDLNHLGIHEIILDPGIGFGKTPLQNIELFDHMDKFEDLKKPILIGHSRKSFIEKAIFDGLTTSLEVKDEATALISWKLVNLGIAYLRIHNPVAHKDLFKILNSIHISW